MSRSEDYLDQLLKGMSSENEKETDSEVTEIEQNELDENIFGNILDEFAEENSPEAEESELQEAVSDEDDLSFDDFSFDDDIFGDDIFGGDDTFDDDDFLKEFELEMAKLENESDDKTGEEDDSLSIFGDLDSILNGAKEQMEAAPVEATPVKTALEEIVVEEEPEVSEPEIEPEEPVMSEESNLALEAFLGASEPAVSEETSIGGFSLEDLFAGDDSDDAEGVAPQEDADVLKILQGLEGIDLELDEEDGSATSATVDSQDFGTSDIESFAFEEPEEAAKQEKKAKKEKKASDKAGFMNKLGLILFGEDDEEEEDEKDKKKKKNILAPGPAEQGEIKIGEASADDLSLFGEYTGDASAGSKEEAPKKDKKEKKKREKKEKVKKEKKPRPKKEKKPKKPKEPDNTPPLPKKPVFLIFLMVGSLLALIIMGADLLGYSNQMTEAKNQYAKKNYSEAFAKISGMEIKKEDQALYEKYHIMAMVSVELEAYESLMEQEFYDMALDCLVRTVGRAEKYRADAKNYGCIQELNALELEAEEILSETFDVSREEALEFYAYRSKKEYSIAIQNVIKELGLEKVTEE